MNSSENDIAHAMSDITNQSLDRVIGGYATQINEGQCGTARDRLEPQVIVYQSHPLPGTSLVLIAPYLSEEPIHQE